MMLVAVLLCYSLHHSPSSNAVEYSNRWSVQIDGGTDAEDRLAPKHGFVNQGKVRVICRIVFIAVLDYNPLQTIKRGCQQQLTWCKVFHA